MNPNEQQVKLKIVKPMSMYFILAHVFFERIFFYGIQYKLLNYLTTELNYDNKAAHHFYHIFLAIVYCFCLFSGFLADSWLGNFKTIILFMSFYLFGGFFTINGNMLAVVFSKKTIVPLILLAIGAGGIKTCVTALYADQYELPEQIRKIFKLFTNFYFSINVAATIAFVSMFLIHGYTLSYGILLLALITSFIIILVGQSTYSYQRSRENMFWLITKCIGNGIATKIKERKTNPRPHWLDYADKKYGRELVNDTKIFLNILFLFIPIHVFWTVFHQQGTTWTYQATQMANDLGFVKVQPEAMQILNPLLVLLFIPMFDVFIYPFLSKIGIRRPLQKMVVGMFLGGMAFLISAIIQKNIESQMPINDNNLRLTNNLPCDYKLNFDLYQSEESTLKAFSNMEININELTTFNLEPILNIEQQTLCPSISGFVSENTFNFTIISAIYENKIVVIDMQQHTFNTNTYHFNIHGRDNFVNSELNPKNESFNYELLIQINNNKIFIENVSKDTLVSTNFKIDEIYKTDIHILWQIPQYVLMTLAEILIAINGLNYAYAQAPDHMKAIIQGCWYFFIGLGNVNTVSMLDKHFHLKSNEMFFFAVVGILNGFAFIYHAFKYHDHKSIFEKETFKLNAVDNVVDDKTSNGNINLTFSHVDA